MAVQLRVARRARPQDRLSSVDVRRTWRRLAGEPQGWATAPLAEGTPERTRHDRGPRGAVHLAGVAAAVALLSGIRRRRLRGRDEARTAVRPRVAAAMPCTAGLRRRQETLARGYHRTA